MAERRMVQVSSSNLLEIGHDGESLFVRFHNGTLWRYEGVPTSTFDQMIASPSVGRFFAAVIRAKFKAVREQA